jgi:hypothetical protein
MQPDVDLDLDATWRRGAGSWRGAGTWRDVSSVLRDLATGNVTQRGAKRQEISRVQSLGLLFAFFCAIRPAGTIIISDSGSWQPPEADPQYDTYFSQKGRHRRSYICQPCDSTIVYLREALFTTASINDEAAAAAAAAR